MLYVHESASHKRDSLTNPHLAGGSFGVVYKAIDKATGETVAIKHVSPPMCAPK